PLPVGGVNLDPLDLAIEGLDRLLRRVLEAVCLQDDGIGTVIVLRLDRRSSPLRRSTPFRAVVPDVGMAVGAETARYDSGLVRRRVRLGRVHGDPRPDDGHRNALDAILVDQLERPKRSLDLDQDLAIQLLLLEGRATEVMPPLGDDARS